MKKLSRSIAILLAVVMAVFAGCDGSGTGKTTPESLTITGKPANNTVEYVENGTVQLGATVTPSGDWTVNWSSSNTAVAVISSSGLVTQKTPGNTVITATVENTTVSDSFTLVLHEEVIVPVAEDITITGKPADNAVDFVLDDTFTLAAEVEPEGDWEVEWSSDNTGVAAISQEGVVTQKGVGTALITASVAGTDISDSFTLIVRGYPSAVTINNKPDSQTTFYSGAEIDVTYSVTAPPHVVAYTVSWFSSDSAIASVSEGSLQSAKITVGSKVGTATVTAKISGTDIEDTFTVKGGGVSATGITINNAPAQNKIYIDGSLTLTATVAPEGSWIVDWTSANEAVAEISASGAVTLKTTGTTLITAAIRGTSLSDSFELSVFGYISDISVTSDVVASKYYYGGDTINAGYVLTSDNHTEDVVEWISSDSAIASVTGSGNAVVVTVGNKAGTATITARVAGKTSISDSFTVIGGGAKPASISFTNRPADDTVDFALNNMALDLNTDRDSYNIVWTSGNTAVATVSQEGVVKHLSAGSTVITATVKDTSISVSFTLYLRGNVTGISISYGKPADGSTYYNGQSISLIYSLTAPEKTHPYTISWTSSNTNIAKIAVGSDTDATVNFGFIKGSVTITVAVDGLGLSDSFTVTGGGEKPVVIDCETPDTTPVNVLYSNVFPQTTGLAIAPNNDHQGEISFTGNAINFTIMGKETAHDWSGIQLKLADKLVNGAKYSIGFDMTITDHANLPALASFNLGLIGAFDPQGGLAAGQQQFNAGPAPINKRVDLTFTSNGTDVIQLFLALKSPAQWAFSLDNLVIARIVPEGLTMGSKITTADLTEKTHQLSVSGNLGYAVNWTSDNTAAATVSDTGLVTLKGAAENVTVTATLAGTNFADSTTFTVTNTTNWFPLEFTIGGYNGITGYDLKGGDVILNLTRTWDFGDYDNDNLAWSLTGSRGDLSAFASIDADGVLSILKSGKAEDSASETVTVTLTYDDNGTIRNIAVVTFTITHNSNEPLVFAVEDAVSNVIDVKDGAQEVTLRYNYTGSNYDKSLVSWELSETSAAIAETEEIDVADIITCKITFKQAVYYKITASLLYDGAVQDISGYFTVVDSGDELLLPVSNDNLVAATKSNASRVESPFGSDGGTKLVFNGSYSGFRFGLANNATFEVGKTYVVLMDIKLLSYESGNTWMYTNCGASMDRRIPLPAAGQSQTVSTVVGPINAGNPSNVSVFVGSVADMTISIANIRVVVSDLAAVPKNVDKLVTGNLITVNDVNNNINSVTANNAGPHLATGIMPDGSFIMHAAGAGGTNPGLAGISATLGTTVAAGTYNVTADITLLHMHHSSTELWFRLGTNNTSNQAAIPLAGIPLLKKTTITFQIVVTAAGTTFRFIDPNTTSSGNIGLIFSNVVITSAV